MPPQQFVLLSQFPQNFITIFLLNLTLNFKDENIAIPEIYYLEEEKKNLSFPFALYLILLMWRRINGDI